MSRVGETKETVGGDARSPCPELNVAAAMCPGFTAMRHAGETSATRERACGEANLSCPGVAGASGNP